MKHSSNQIANAITTALQLYIDGKQDFICNALEHMERNHGLSWTLSVTCIEVVRASIDDHYVFESYHDYKNGFIKGRPEEEYRKARIEHFQALIKRVRQGERA